MREIDIDQLDTRLQEGAALVDVREAGEYAQAHVPAEVEAVNVAGGMAAWMRSGRPVETGL
jgi:rhodanese-related sulfurtransferase